MKLTLKVLFLLLVNSGLVMAQEPQPSATVFTSEQHKEAKAALLMLGQAFGVGDGTQQAPTQPATTGQAQPEKKTMADIADRALDMTASAVTAIAGQMEKVAPEVWAVMVRQQYAKAFGSLVGPWGAFFLILIATFIARKSWKLTPEEASGRFFSDRNGDAPTNRGWRGFFTFLLPLCFMGIFAGVGIYRLADSIMFIINPYFYAIKDLLQMLLHQGSM
ncbi:MAG: hypothetical protein UT86_C0006G0015 [Candidatus Magasanikbacteria bacterium GW2011_GWC2_40_17]|uniref:Uncharacterized protein n=1 Tax=Candidatus Magasanikbacteria bacterium GW2011_GWA2_42_32 TaxID=1619039 RepID=A0A0G1A6S9_9BACT|nr:MAG: hypothetical protein UT86_C0006G0015 [Candidatus Magasanikbacteria bacterium GW2011_GWC2_40_17]KKS56639.1 MAG: hypothetical protein UV20_C0008G0015 [Candidatus Magasanikbacteria bacterium GW2011_GWA2_42_32]OGH86096.1 MAG: hypothetical protein A2294_04100 [Candidatus Magasanikbacteria bacterium RIFOXYB2_FULL_38_10]